MWRLTFPPDIMPIFKAAQIMCISLFYAVGFAAAAVAAAILLMENTFDGKCNNPQKSRKKGNSSLWQLDYEFLTIRKNGI